MSHTHLIIKPPDLSWWSTNFVIPVLLRAWLYLSYAMMWSGSQRKFCSGTKTLVSEEVWRKLSITPCLCLPLTSSWLQHLLGWFSPREMKALLFIKGLISSLVKPLLHLNPFFYFGSTPSGKTLSLRLIHHSLPHCTSATRRRSLHTPLFWKLWVVSNFLCMSRATVNCVGRLDVTWNVSTLVWGTAWIF